MAGPPWPGSFVGGRGRVLRALAPSVPALFLFGLAGCGGSPTAPGPVPPPPAVTISCPADARASSLDGRPVAVAFDPPAVQGGTSPFTVTCTPASASAFPVGGTAVTCTVVDSAGLTASCSFTVQVAVIPRLGATRFVAFGDSLTAGVVSTPLPLLLALAESYPTLLGLRLRDRYAAQTFTVANAGLAGEQAAEGVLRLPGVLTQDGPEVLLLLEGANDLIWWGKADPGVTRAAAAIDEMVKEAQRRGVTVYLATLPPWRQGGPKQLDQSLPPLLNLEIARIARDKGPTLVDLYSAMIGDLDTLIGSDGLHPTEAGYQRIAQVFFESIRATLETIPP